MTYRVPMEMILQKFSDAVSENQNILCKRGYSNDKIISLIKKFTSSDSSNQKCDDGVSRDSSLRATTTVRPWSRDDCISRLRTFSSALWFAKPSCLSPIICARFGWTVGAFDCLHCPSCGTNIRHDLVDDADGMLLSAQLSSAHESFCGWRGNACDPCILQLPYTPPETMRHGFMARFGPITDVLRHSLLAGLYIQMPTAITNEIRMEYAQGYRFHTPLQLLSDHITQTSANVNMQGCDVVHTVDRLEGDPAAVVLALCGWTLMVQSSDAAATATSTVPTESAESTETSSPTPHTHGVLHCTVCARRLQLDLFRSRSQLSDPLATGPSNLTVGSSVTHSSLTIQPTAILDPIDQHCTWCPWAHNVGPEMGSKEGPNAVLSSSLSSSGWRQTLTAFRTASNTTMGMAGMADTGVGEGREEVEGAEASYKRIRLALDVSGDVALRHAINR